MTYPFLIAANLALGALDHPFAILNLIAAAFVGGLWLADIVNRKTA